MAFKSISGACLKYYRGGSKSTESKIKKNLKDRKTFDVKIIDASEGREKIIKIKKDVSAFIPKSCDVNYILNHFTRDRIVEYKLNWNQLCTIRYFCKTIEEFLNNAPGKIEVLN